MDLYEVYDIVENIRLNQPELYRFVNGGLRFWKDPKPGEETMLSVKECRCYDYISRVKWHFGFSCKKNLCRGGKSGPANYDILFPSEIREVYKKEKPYSAMCMSCYGIESPTAGTRLHKLTPMYILFEFIIHIFSQKKEGRLSDEEIQILMNRRSAPKVKPKRRGKRRNIKSDEINDIIYLDRTQKQNIFQSELETIKNIIDFYTGVLQQMENDETKNHRDLLVPIEKFIEHNAKYLEVLESTCNTPRVSANKIKEYRYMLQQYMGDWHFGVGTGTGENPYGLQKFWLVKGSCKKLVIVSRHLRPNGHIRAKVYDSDTIENFYDFTRSYIPVSTYLILYGWNSDYTDQIQYGSRLDFDKYYDDFDINPFPVQEVTERLKNWFRGRKEKAKAQKKASDVVTNLSLENNERVQMHINECLFLNYYELLNPAMLIVLLVHFPSKKLYDRKAKGHPGISEGRLPTYNEIFSSIEKKSK